MEEIKELVNQGKAVKEGSEESQGQEGFDNDMGDQLDSFEQSFSDDGKGFGQPEDKDLDFGSQSQQIDQNQEFGEDTEFPQNQQDQQSFDQQQSFNQPQQPQNEPQPQQEPEEDNTEPQTPSRKPTAESQESQEDRGESRPSNLDNQIPDPPKTKKINVPEIEKGPLFIRRKKFESAVNMIEEMRYLSREIEEVVNRLEQGINQDRETEKEARNILHAIEDDRRGVQDIISPEKKESQ